MFKADIKMHKDLSEKIVLNVNVCIRIIFNKLLNFEYMNNHNIALRKGYMIIYQ